MNKSHTVSGYNTPSPFLRLPANIFHLQGHPFQLSHRFSFLKLALRFIPLTGLSSVVGTPLFGTLLCPR